MKKTWSRQQEALAAECRKYFKERAVFRKLFAGFREKYASYGSFSGTVVLRNLTGDDIEELEGFLQKSCHGKKSVSVSAGKFEKALADSRFHIFSPQEVLELLRGHGASERHARALLRLNAPEQQLEAARQVVEDSLTVAQTETLVDGILLSKAPPARRRPTFVIKDVRLFLNTITRSLDIMRSAGVDAQCSRQDSEEEIMLTIHIPRRAG